MDLAGVTAIGNKAGSGRGNSHYKIRVDLARVTAIGYKGGSGRGNSN